MVTTYHGYPLFSFIKYLLVTSQEVVASNTTVQAMYRVVQVLVVRGEAGVGKGETGVEMKNQGGVIRAVIILMEHYTT